MRARTIYCYIGNYDGLRDGMIYAASAVDACHVVHCSLYHFREYWHRQPLPRPIARPNAMTLYTKRNNFRDTWHEGVCPL